MTQTFTSNTRTEVIKLLYSYGGKIVPRRFDGKLRYIGGHTRVLSVYRSITFAELMIKFGELCGASMSLKCKLPNEDLDVLISVKSDEDLRNVIEEYERFSLSTNQEAKIRAVLSPINLPKKISPPSSPISCFDFPAAAAPKAKPPLPYTAANRCFSPAVGYPIAALRKVAAENNGVRNYSDHRRVYFNNSQLHYRQ